MSTHITLEITLTQDQYKALLESALDHDLAVERRAEIAIRAAIREGLE
jgi:hypothetical protein